MSANYDNKEADRFLAEAAIILPDEPGPTLELLDAVAPPTVNTVGTEGMAPCEGSEGKLQRGEGVCQRPPPSIALVATYDTHKSPLVFHHLGFARVDPGPL